LYTEVENRYSEKMQWRVQNFLLFHSDGVLRAACK
jgi:hypothetical protein